MLAGKQPAVSDSQRSLPASNRACRPSTLHYGQPLARFDAARIPSSRHGLGLGLVAFCGKAFGARWVKSLSWRPNGAHLLHRRDRTRRARGPYRTRSRVRPHRRFRRRARRLPRDERARVDQGARGSLRSPEWTKDLRAERPGADVLVPLRCTAHYRTHSCKSGAGREVPVAVSCNRTSGALYGEGAGPIRTEPTTGG